MATLFGVPVPAAATTVIIRPILGKGSAMALYEGTVLDLTDLAVIQSASKNRDLWDYLEDRDIEIPEFGQTISWKLRLQFLNAQGIAEEAVCTETKFDFHRSKKLMAKDQGAVDAKQEFALFAAQTMEMFKVAASATADMVAKASASAAQMMAAGAAPTAEAVKAQTDQRKDDMAFRDEAMKALMKVLGGGTGQAQPPAHGDIVDSLTKLAGLWGAARALGLGSTKKKDEPN